MTEPLLDALRPLVAELVRAELARVREDDPVVDVAAELAATHDRRQVYRICRAGKIPGASHPPGTKTWVARRSAITAWIESCRPAPRVPDGDEDESPAEMAERLGIR